MTPEYEQEIAANLERAEQSIQAGTAHVSQPQAERRFRLRRVSSVLSSPCLTDEQRQNTA